MVSKLILVLVVFSTMAVLSVADDQETVTRNGITGIVAKDFGRIPATQMDGKFQFHWLNDTGASVQVDKVMTSCTCQTMEYPRGLIRDGEVVQFVMNIDLHNKSGFTAAAVVVQFKGDVAPLKLEARFFREASFSALPASIQFGTLQAGTPNSTSERVFRWIYVGTDSSEDVSIDPDKITTVHSNVVCHLTKSSESVEQEINTTQPSYIKKFFFSVSPVENLAPGRFEDTVSVPISIGGRAQVLVVPVGGEIQARLFTRPNKIIAILTPSDTMPQNLVADIYYFGLDKWDKSIVVSGDPNLTIIQEAKEPAKDGFIMRLHIAVAATLDIRQGYSTSISIHVGSDEFQMPIKILSVTTSK